MYGPLMHVDSPSRAATSQNRTTNRGPANVRPLKLLLLSFLRNHLAPSYHEAKDGLLDGWIDRRRRRRSSSSHPASRPSAANHLPGVAAGLCNGCTRPVSVARYVVDNGWDRGFPTIQRRSLYSPFSHLEDLRDQEVSVRLFTELDDPYHLQFARDFYEKVRRHGRFKHRDGILRMVTHSSGRIPVLSSRQCSHICPAVRCHNFSRPFLTSTGFRPHSTCPVSNIHILSPETYPAAPPSGHLHKGFEIRILLH
ncbi:uncharacterized protein BDV17DRAFT_261993 [Aspergillus undulatus]|uniref:uncharacterized protein n=1 Tax=Aspergillus undulatus TaxID=1810928 RepID=UPI003CCCC2A5